MSESRLSPGIAIVDDEKELVDVYQRLFRQRKLTVCFVASNGVEAVAAYRASPVKPDIVIMDNRMPLMNGLDAMRAIRAIDCHVRFILLSADASVKDEALAMGAVFMKKPSSLKDLLKCIESLSSGPDVSGPGGRGPARDCVTGDSGR